MVRLECEFLMRGLDFLLVRQWVGKRMEGEMGGEGFYWLGGRVKIKQGCSNPCATNEKAALLPSDVLAVSMYKV